MHAVCDASAEQHTAVGNQQHTTPRTQPTEQGSCQLQRRVPHMHALTFIIQLSTATVRVSCTCLNALTRFLSSNFALAIDHAAAYTCRLPAAALPRLQLHHCVLTMSVMLSNHAAAAAPPCSLLPCAVPPVQPSRVQLHQPLRNVVLQRSHQYLRHREHHRLLTLQRPLH